MSKGQGLTRDTLDEVTDAEDLWLQSLERKKPDKKPRTADASPVSRAMVTAWNRKDHCESELVILILLLTMVRGRLGSSESDLLDFTEIIENCINHHVQYLSPELHHTTPDTSQEKIRLCSPGSFVVW